MRGFVGFILVFMVSLNPEWGWGQSTPGESDLAIQEILEEMAGNGYSESAIEETLANLLQLLQNPINLNHTNGDELGVLPFLNENQVDRLLLFVRKYGPLRSVYELQFAEGLDLDLNRKLAPFVTCGPSGPLRTYSLVEQISGANDLSFQSKFRQVLERQAGYQGGGGESEEQGYLGSTAYYSAKLQIGNRRKWKAGIGIEKDAGERAFYRGRPVDFLTGFIEIRDVMGFERIVVGDYRVQFGQGLVCGPGFGLVKSVESPLAFSLRGPFLRAHSSTNEQSFQRGLAGSYRKGSFVAGFFLSARKVDGNLDTLSDFGTDEIFLTSLPETGYHRTLSEWQNRRVVDQRIAGTRIGFVSDAFQFGISTVLMKIRVPWAEEASAPYQFFRNRETDQANAGLDFRIKIPGGLLFGEGAFDKSRQGALFAGASFFPTSAMGLTLSYRSYARSYSAALASPPAENSQVGNEEGWFLGLEMVPVSKIKLSGFFDLYRFPWLRYGVDRPSMGTDAGIQLSASPSKETSLYLRYKRKIKQVNSGESTSGLNQIGNGLREQVRLQFETQPAPRLKSETRLEWQSYQEPTGSILQGLVVYQGLKFEMEALPVQWMGRLVFFETDAYETRMYAYENDLPGEFSVPALAGRGMRSYCMARVTLFKSFQIWVRYSKTFYSDRSTVGTGLDEIAGPARSDLKLMVRYTL